VQPACRAAAQARRTGRLLSTLTIQSFVMPKENLDAEGNESLLTKKWICPIHAEPIHVQITP